MLGLLIQLHVVISLKKPDTKNNSIQDNGRADETSS